MIKLVFEGMCENCPNGDLEIEVEQHWATGCSYIEHKVRCKHFDACYRLALQYTMQGMVEDAKTACERGSDENQND